MGKLQKVAAARVGLGDLASSSPNLLCVQYGPAEVVAAPLSLTLRVGWAQANRGMALKLTRGLAGHKGAHT